jgi:hypothetical protein
MLGRGQVGFLAVMIPTLGLSLVYASIVYSSLCELHPPHPLAENVAVPQIPAVLLSGLCFYIIGIWKSGPGQSQFPPHGISETQRSEKDGRS